MFDMRTDQVIIGVVGIGLYWLLIRFILHHKNTLAKSELEQQKLKKKLYWSIAYIFIFYFGTQLLINSKTTGWTPWAIILAYIVLWALGGYFVLQSYLIGINKDTTRVKKLNGQIFNNPQRFARSVAILNLIFGISIWLLAIAIPVFKIKLASWAPFIFLLAWLRFLVMGRLEKDDPT